MTVHPNRLPLAGTHVLALVCVLGLVGGCVTTAPAASGPRPASWATPVAADPGLPNLHRVNAFLYRSAQPSRAGFGFLESRPRLVTGDPPINDVVKFLRIATTPALQPVLVHCQHGSDRTGTMVAVYRIVVEGWTKAQATDEMVNGGFGFHPMWQNLLRYIDALDVDAIRSKVDAQGPWQ